MRSVPAGRGMAGRTTVSYREKYIPARTETANKLDGLGAYVLQIATRKPRTRVRHPYGREVSRASVLFSYCHDSGVVTNAAQSDATSSAIRTLIHGSGRGARETSRMTASEVRT